MTIETILLRMKAGAGAPCNPASPEEGYNNTPIKQSCNTRHPCNPPRAESASQELQELIRGAAEAAGLAPGTLYALLSFEDYKDLVARRMTEAELRWYALSIRARWRSGALLPDEWRLRARTRLSRLEPVPRASKESRNGNQ